MRMKFWKNCEKESFAICDSLGTAFGMISGKRKQQGIYDGKLWVPCCFCVKDVDVARGGIVYLLISKHRMLLFIGYGTLGRSIFLQISKHTMF